MSTNKQKFDDLLRSADGWPKILTDRGESVTWEDGWKITRHWIKNKKGHEWQAIKYALPPKSTNRNPLTPASQMRFK